MNTTARALLELLAWLAPEPIPEFLLDVAIPDRAVAEPYDDAIADMAAFSMVTHDKVNPQFSIHRLVQDVTRRSLGADASRTRLAEAELDQCGLFW